MLKKLRFLKPANKKILFLYVLGVVVLLYPFFSYSYSKWVQRGVVNQYEERVTKLDRKRIEDMTEKMRKHNKQLLDKQELLDEIDFGIDAEESMKASELGEVLGVLDIPKISIKLPIYAGTNEAQISQGAGVMKGTSFPVGGENTHSVITSHRGLPSAKLFTDLPELKKKDMFFIRTGGKTLAYEVDQIQVIEPQDFSQLEIIKGEDLITLLTCTPYMLNTHRLLVRGHRVDPYSDKLHRKSTIQGIWQKFKKLLIYLLIALPILAFFYWFNKNNDEVQKTSTSRKITKPIKKKGKQTKIKERQNQSKLTKEKRKQVEEARNRFYEKKRKRRRRKDA